MSGANCDLPSNLSFFESGVVKSFQKLLQMKTISPRGNEIEAVNYLQLLFNEHDIKSSTIIKSAEHRGNIITRLEGNGKKQPLLLAAHLDVVPADEKSWIVPPFSGDIRENWIWGRGAIDMKNMAAMSAWVMIRLKQENITLNRDVIFAGVADEECGCTYGSEYLVEKFPELVRAEFVLGEVGGYTLHLNNRRYYPVQVAEKGVCWLKLTVKGTSGHGSMPRPDNPLYKLANIIKKIENSLMPQHNVGTVTNFIKFLAKDQAFPSKNVLPLLIQPAFSELILKKLMPDQNSAQAFRALLRNTISPTCLEGSKEINVIPGEASVYIDGRILPGQTTASFLSELETIIGKDVIVEIVREMKPVETNPESELYDIIQGILAVRDPGSKVVPYMIPGFTDAKNFSKLGAKCYGFSPVKMPIGVSFNQLYHGVDERIPLDGFLWGYETLYQVVKRFLQN